MIDKTKIKVFAFDFDDTLYCGVDWTDYAKFCKTGLRYMFPNLSEDEFKELSTLKESETYNDVIIRNALEKLNSADKWLEYRDIYECIMDFSNVIVVSNNVLKELSDNYVLYIVSDSTKKYVERDCRLLNINLKYFKEILINKYDISDPTKKLNYEYIIDKEKIKPSELLVVGNNYRNDIAPALLIGAQVKHITSSDFVADDLFE